MKSRTDVVLSTVIVVFVLWAIGYFLSGAPLARSQTLALNFAFCLVVATMSAALALIGYDTYLDEKKREDK
jgi:hypothetical protein